MKLFLLTRREFFVEEDKILSALFDEGLDMLHIRKPGAEPVFAERLLTLLHEDCRNRIMVHEHFYLKEEFDLRGVHISPDSEPLPPTFRGLRSASCHSLQELQEKRNQFDYVFLSPVRDSISNANHKAAFTPDELREAAKSGLINKRVIACGGIDVDNIREMRDYGFGGVCILGSLWQYFLPHKTSNYKELIHHFRSLRKAAD